jgi:hypothetical protein
LSQAATSSDNTRKADARSAGDNAGADTGGSSSKRDEGATTGAGEGDGAAEEI